jgi:hypothetical protein
MTFDPVFFFTSSFQTWTPAWRFALSMFPKAMLFVIPLPTLIALPFLRRHIPLEAKRSGTVDVVGAVLVSIMILLFLGDWRMTLIATMSIPLAVMGAIIGLYATGNTINAMTLGGLALAIGPLVDEAIVESLSQWKR